MSGNCSNEIFVLLRHGVGKNMCPTGRNQSFAVSEHNGAELKMRNRCQLERNDWRQHLFALICVVTFSNNSTHSDSWCKVGVGDIIHKTFHSRRIKKSMLDRYEQPHVHDEPLRRRKRGWETTKLGESPIRVMQSRCLILRQWAASAHRMQQRCLQGHNTLRLHRDRDLMALEILESCGGQNRELGDNHDVNLSHMGRHAGRLILLNVNVIANLVLLKPQTDVFQRLRASICHFWRLRSHLRDKLLLTRKIRDQRPEFLVELLVPQLVWHALEHDIKLMSAAPNANRAWVCNFLEPCRNARDAAGNVSLAVRQDADYSILPRRPQAINSLRDRVKNHISFVLVGHRNGEKMKAEDVMPAEMQTHSDIKIECAHMCGHA